MEFKIIVVVESRTGRRIRNASESEAAFFNASPHRVVARLRLARPVRMNDGETLMEYTGPGASFAGAGF